MLTLLIDFKAFSWEPIDFFALDFLVKTVNIFNRVLKVFHWHRSDRLLQHIETVRMVGSQGARYDCFRSCCYDCLNLRRTCQLNVARLSLSTLRFQVERRALVKPAAVCGLLSELGDVFLLKAILEHVIVIC